MYLIIKIEFEIMNVHNNTQDCCFNGSGTKILKA